MPSVLYELENNETLLLMYVCGELPDEDRVEVEQMLSSDGGLRLELEEIRSALADSMDVLAALDSHDPISASAAPVSVRNVSRLMKQWKVDRLRAQPTEVSRRAWRYPLWVYPTSAVASVLVGVLFWWGVSSPAPLEIARDGTGTAQLLGQLPGVPADPSSPVAQNNETGRDGRADDRNSDDSAAVLRNSFMGSEPAGLADAEAQASSLVLRTDDSVSSVFPNEPSQ